MQGLRDLIVRRRPSLDHEDEVTEAVDVTNGDVPGIDARHLRNARAGRDRVPDPAELKPEPFRPTMGEADDAAPEAEAAVPAPEVEGAAAVAEAETVKPVTTPKIWDIEPPVSAALEPKAEPAAQPAAATAASGGALARCAESPLSPALRDRAQPAPDRAKTRLLGFHADSGARDALDADPVPAATGIARFPVGWIVVMDGPGRGASFTLTSGLSTVGRDAGQTICLDFGDTAISREGHVAIAHDDEENCAYVGHGGKSNIVRLNDKPLLSTEPLNDGDTIRIGKTVLRFVAFCTPDFSWSRDAEAQDG